VRFIITLLGQFFGVLDRMFLEYSFSRNESSRGTKVPGSESYVGYCEVYHHTVRSVLWTFGSKVLGIGLFFLEERKFQFQGAKVLGTFTPEERKFHRSECSTERKVQGSESSLCGLFAPKSESAEERKSRYMDSRKLPAIATKIYIMPSYIHRLLALYLETI